MRGKNLGFLFVCLFYLLIFVVTYKKITQAVRLMAIKRESGGNPEQSRCCKPLLKGFRH